MGSAGRAAGLVDALGEAARRGSQALTALSDHPLDQLGTGRDVVDQTDALTRSDDAVIDLARLQGLTASAADHQGADVFKGAATWPVLGGANLARDGVVEMVGRVGLEPTTKGL
jgi:hypothetical protein